MPASQSVQVPLAVGTSFLLHWSRTSFILVWVLHRRQ